MNDFFPQGMRNSSLKSLEFCGPDAYGRIASGNLALNVCQIWELKGATFSNQAFIKEKMSR